VSILGSSWKLRKEAALALDNLKDAARDAGISMPVASAYRSYALQETLYNDYVKKDGKAKADTYSARPGYSEHQTGLAVDFSPIDDAFKDSSQYEWLVKNAHRFGFVLRYPEGKDSVTGYTFEPWHWRYIGVEAATDMYTKGESTLEQYYEVSGGLYADQEQTNTDPKPADPQTPSTPVEPAPPVPAPEAAASATKFVTRLGTQFATVALTVQGFAGLLKIYTGFVIDAGMQGWITIIGTIILIAAMQFGYKVGSNIKWPF
jgi:hypothetical protein